MKYGSITTYVNSIFNKNAAGESYWSILRYFWPEYITSFVIFALPFWIDSYLISFLHSTPAYATQGTTNNTLHLLFKVAEAFSIGIVVLVGNFNGLGLYKKAGRVFHNAFWVSTIFGLICGSIFFFKSTSVFILSWLNVSPEIIEIGIPFWRLRAIGIFFTFFYLSFIGFLRAIKNTRTPMFIFLIGAATFIFFDYGLLFGAFGLPKLGFNGSAWASVIQSIVMSIAAIMVVLYHDDYKEYRLEIFSSLFKGTYFKELFYIIWPVAIDKATLAFAYIWLSKMLNCMGTCSTASFCAFKDLERFAFLPAIACAQVITFLVSNDYSIHNWAGIKDNIKKVMILAAAMVFAILVLFSAYPEFFMQIFDKKGEFSGLITQIFPIISVLVFFDLIQLILSGALRGASDVKVVMWTRLAVCLGYFVPISYVLSLLPLSSHMWKFLLIYGSFYLGNALMSIVYIMRLCGSKWKKDHI